jgi:hypothetical protein
LSSFLISRNSGARQPGLGCNGFELLSHLPGAKIFTACSRARNFAQCAINQERNPMASKIVPIRGKFHTARAALASVMDDDTVESFVMVCVHKDGNTSQIHFEMESRTMAWAALLIGQWALEEDT